MRPGSHHGTPVCVRTSTDVEQQSDHNQMTPFGMESWDCGAPCCSLREVPRGANLNWYAGQASDPLWTSGCVVAGGAMLFLSLGCTLGTW